MNNIEILGYIASGFIVASFLVSNNLRVIRMVNLIGALLFIAYGLFIQKIPVVLPNIFIALIQLYYLVLKKK